jgi:hypothetical protein
MFAAKQSLLPPRRGSRGIQIRMGVMHYNIALDNKWITWIRPPLQGNQKKLDTL